MFKLTNRRPNATGTNVLRLKHKRGLHREVATARRRMNRYMFKHRSHAFSTFNFLGSVWWHSRDPSFSVVPFLMFGDACNWVIRRIIKWYKGGLSVRIFFLSRTCPKVLVHAPYDAVIIDTFLDRKGQPRLRFTSSIREWEEVNEMKLAAANLLTMPIFTIQQNSYKYMWIVISAL